MQGGREMRRSRIGRHVETIMIYNINNFPVRIKNFRLSKKYCLNNELRKLSDKTFPPTLGKLLLVLTSTQLEPTSWTWA